MTKSKINFEPAIVVLFLLLSIIMLLNVYMGIELIKNSNFLILANINVLPSFSDLKQNFNLALDGFREGYIRSLLGYIYFILMCMFFFSSGNFFVYLIFKNTDVLTDLRYSERISLNYIVGTLVASILWLILGIVGCLNNSIAIIVCALGFLLFIYSFSVRANIFVKLKYLIKNDFFSLSPIEKLSTLFIIIFLLLLSTTSARFQTYSDTLLTHLVLPNFYINEGKVVTYPYHIHSYLPQNTEMLVMWALLLKSEMAAALTIWGFMAAFCLLIFGFVKRETDHFSAMIAVLITLSLPTIVWFSTTIKSDLPVGLFLFAHYYSLSKAFKYDSKTIIHKRWILLSAIILGGAIGHKLIALPAAFVSGIVLYVHMLRGNKDGKEAHKYILNFIVGVFIVIIPWFVRTTIATGNPVYPYMNKIFGNKMIKPWHSAIRQENSIKSKGLFGLRRYLRNYFGLSKENNHFIANDLGPIALLVLGAFIIFIQRNSDELMVTTIATLVSLLIMISYSLEIRYQIGFISFLICNSIRMIYLMILENKSIKIYKRYILIVTLLSFFIALNETGIANAIVDFSNVIISGYSLGNYHTTDDGMDNLRWLFYLINRITDRNARVMFVGINYTYGIRRKIYFSSDLDKQLVEDIASKSKSDEEFVIAIKELNISDFVIDNHYLVKTCDSDNGRKIGKFIKLNLQKITDSPNKQFSWYTINSSKSVRLSLMPSDAVCYSYMYIKHCQNIESKKEAIPLLENVIEVPMIKKNKHAIYRYLESLYVSLGSIESSKKLLLKEVEYDPNDPEAYGYLAIYYKSIGDMDKAQYYVNKYFENGGRKNNGY